MKEKILALLKNHRDVVITVKHHVPRGRGGWKGTTTRDDQYILVDGKLMKKTWNGYFYMQVFNEKYTKTGRDYRGTKIFIKGTETEVTFDDYYQVVRAEANKREENFVKENGYIIIDFTKDPNGELRIGKVFQCSSCDLWRTADPNSSSGEAGRHKYCRDDNGVWLEIPHFTQSEVTQ